MAQDERVRASLKLAYQLPLTFGPESTLSASTQDLLAERTSSSFAQACLVQNQRFGACPVWAEEKYELLKE
jgi:hypothetical protein